jgi:hypothetical protein
VTITNGITCQTEIWYKVAAGGDQGPAFVVSATTLYAQLGMEVSGFTGTPTLQLVGVATGTTVATLGVLSSTGTADPGLFMVGGIGDREGATSGITFSASTALNSATFGADLDAVNPPKNGEGIRDAWATSGAAGTQPGIQFNLSAATNTTLAACLATFKAAAAAAADPFPAGYIRDADLNPLIRMSKKAKGLWTPKRRIFVPTWN